jgi:hypothetical protein
MKRRPRCLRAALNYAKLGWRVFPLHGKTPYEKGGHNTATVDRKQIRRWWRQYPDANVGIACNSARGPIVADSDGASGKAVLVELELPETMEAESREGRSHHYFAPPVDGTAIARMIKPLMGENGKKIKLDILGDGGYVVAPPSIHPDTGKPYKWVRHQALAPFPETLLRLIKGARGNQTAAPPLPEIITEGARDELLTSLAGSMRQRGASPSAVLAALREENSVRVRPPLSDSQLQKIARSIGAKPTGKRPTKKESVVLRLHDVEEQKVRWIVPDLLAEGKVVLLEGDPGLSKSTLALYFAAKLTRGESILGSPAIEPANVAILSYEDDPSDTVKPRILAQGGNPKRIYVLRGIIENGDCDSESPPVLPNDLPEFEALIRKRRTKLAIIDPLSAALSERTDSHNDSSVRRVMAKLAAVAERTGACILGIRHLAKSGHAKAITAGGGSIAFNAAARVVILVAEHPEDADKKQHERRRVMATVKNNISPHRDSQVFEVVARDRRSAPRIRWLGKADFTADELNQFRSAAVSGETLTDFKQCCEWLGEQLGNGEVPQKDVVREGRKAGRWKEATLRRALKRIGGISKQKKFAGAYFWGLRPGRGS